MARMNKCCVPGSNDMVSKRHRFPKNNPSLFKTWIDIVKPNNWQTLYVQQIYNRYYVCHTHFEDQYILEGSLRGLTVHAIPTLGVEGFSAVSDVSMNQPSTSEVQSVMESTNEGSFSTVSDDSMNQPSTSKVQNVMESTNEGSFSAVSDDSMNQPSTFEIQNVMESRNERSFSAVSDVSMNQLSTFEIQNVMESTNEGIHNPSNVNRMAKTLAVSKKVKGTKISSGKFEILRKLKYSRKIQLNPKEKILYDMLCKCRDQLNFLLYKQALV